MSVVATAQRPDEARVGVQPALRHPVVGGGRNRRGLLRIGQQAAGQRGDHRQVDALAVEELARHRRGIARLLQRSDDLIERRLVARAEKVGYAALAPRWPDSTAQLVVVENGVD